MSESLSINSSKEEIYRAVLQQIEAVIGGTGDLIANLANVTAVLKQAFNKFHWVGFCRTTAANVLTLGPFQGPRPVYAFLLIKACVALRPGCRRLF